MNKDEKEHLENSILKPYLAHVEFEVMNIQNQIIRDSVIRKALMEKQLSIYNIENKIQDFLIWIRQIRSIFRYSIN